MKIEIHFNPGLEDSQTKIASELARQIGGDFQKDDCIVTFSDTSDPALLQLLDYIAFMKDSCLYLDGELGVDRNSFDNGERALELGTALIDLNLIDAAERFVKMGLVEFKEDVLLLEVLAQIEVIRQNYPKALNYLERALDQGDPAAVVLAEERFAPLRDLPRFKKLKSKY